MDDAERNCDRRWRILYSFLFFALLVLIKQNASDLNKCAYVLCSIRICVSDFVLDSTFVVL